MAFGYLDTLLFGIVFLHLIASYQQLRRLSSSLNWISYRSSLKDAPSEPNVVYILIPVFNEDKRIIKGCADYFRLFSLYAQVHIYFITTDKNGKRSDTVITIRN